MNFFAAQTRARNRTGRLLILFALAVLGTATGVYFALMLALREAIRIPVDTARHVDMPPALAQWWNPEMALYSFLGVGLLVAIASIYKWSTLGAGGPAVAKMMGGRLVTPNTTEYRERQLLNIVEEMSIASGIPSPQIYVLDEELSINAFAAGLSVQDAVVAVSAGALREFPRDELQAVVGHEFSHILNGDMRRNLKLTAVLFGILALAILGQFLLRVLLRILASGQTGGSRRDNKKDNGLAVISLLGLLGLGLVVAGSVGFFFGRLIQAAVSRQREYLADASSVQFTRNPRAMADALNRIRARSSLIRSPHASEISHFFFAQSFDSLFASLFATHPPLPARIQAIIPGYDFPKPAPTRAKP
ncbi:MAG: M48 family metallopeptidase [Puniceicoccales bacterium]|jgi:Zn-dependent protease with chaperone function|nr:M48 family metallopeptidase [Puniceicoccales bacterium]